MFTWLKIGTGVGLFVNTKVSLLAIQDVGKISGGSATANLLQGFGSTEIGQLQSPSTHYIRGWLDHRAGLDDNEKRKFLTLPGLDLRPLSCPVRSYPDCATEDLYATSTLYTQLFIIPLFSLCK